MAKKNETREPEVVGRLQDDEDPLRDAILQGHALMRIQGQEMAKVALLKKREPAKVLEQALAELDLAPELAAACYYSIGYRERAGDQDSPEHKVEGLSIDAAANLARIWGNADIRSVILSDDGDEARVDGVFLDMETNVRWSRPLSVSRFQKRRGGGVVRLGDERWKQSIAAALSKAERNATLRMLPHFVKFRYFERCKEIATELEKETAEKKGKKPWQVIQERFQALGVNRTELEKLLEKKLPKVSDEDIAHLRGVFNSLRSGERSWAEIMGASGAGPAKTDEPSSAEEAIAAGAEAEGGTEAPPAQAEPETQADPEVVPDVCPANCRFPDLVREQGHAPDCPEYPGKKATVLAE